MSQSALKARTNTAAKRSGRSRIYRPAIPVLVVAVAALLGGCA
ncbi:MAG: pilus assembly protein CpaD, partial [Mesorhizobium sp.]